MRIGGLIKFSLVDYPGKVAAVVFTQGCNFRCPFCHNKELVIPNDYRKPLPEQEVLDFLEQRRDKLQGVVVTGGEPAIQKDLPEFLFKVKNLGYCIKLDTNGSRPRMLRRVIAAGLADFLAMDVKASLAHYATVAGAAVEPDAIRESMEIIRASGLPHMFRTTVVRPLVEEDDLAAVAALTNGSAYRLQPFSPSDGLIDPQLAAYPQYTPEEFDRLQARWEKGVFLSGKGLA